MKTKDGDTVKNLFNGKYYKVKKITKGMAVLQSEDGQSQILTEVENLNLFYEKMEDIRAVRVCIETL
ncbi:MAG: hypothetical protein ABSG44_03085 [Thermodesulfobacteriota bacterium]|jgi:hypothetical protein